MTSPYLKVPLRDLADVEAAEAARATVTSWRTPDAPPLPPRFDIPAFLRRPPPPRDLDARRSWFQFWRLT
jgi:hypothetical protein